MDVEESISDSVWQKVIQNFYSSLIYLRHAMTQFKVEHHLRWSKEKLHNVIVATISSHTVTDILDWGGVGGVALWSVCLRIVLYCLHKKIKRLGSKTCIHR